MELPCTSTGNAKVQQCSDAAGEQSQDGQESSAAGAACALVFVTFTFVQTAYLVRHRPGDLAFVVFAYSALTMLLYSLRRFERLTLGSPAAERRGIKLAVWCLSTALSVVFAWHVAGAVPVALGVAVWAMTSVVALVGFYGLFLYRDSAYSELESCKEATTPDEMV